MAKGKAKKEGRLRIALLTTMLGISLYSLFSGLLKSMWESFGIYNTLAQDLFSTVLIAAVLWLSMGAPVTKSGFNKVFIAGVT